jgi:hypothetical protein
MQTYHFILSTVTLLQTLMSIQFKIYIGDTLNLRSYYQKGL